MAITDVHVDRPENMAWLRALAQRAEHSHDVLILCGDVADTIPVLGEALEVGTHQRRKYPHPEHHAAEQGIPEQSMPSTYVSKG